MNLARQRNALANLTHKAQLKCACDKFGAQKGNEDALVIKFSVCDKFGAQKGNEDVPKCRKHTLARQKDVKVSRAKRPSSE